MKLQLTFLAVVAITLCGSMTIQAQSTQNGKTETNIPPVYKVKAVDYAFVAPDTIPAGLVTLRMPNEGKETHYMEIDRLPEGKTFQEYRTTLRELMAQRDSLITLLSEGSVDTAEVIKKLSEPVRKWNGGGTGLLDLGSEAGGIGLVAPSLTAQTTLHLRPGKYVMSCNMPTSEGQWHSELGMVRPITVKENNSGGSPPKSDVTISFSPNKLITEGKFTSGRQSVAFHVEEVSNSEENIYVGAHLARLETRNEIEQVLNWIKEDSFKNPAPTTFLGGADEIVDGQTAFVELDLEPGRYAWFIYPFTSDPKILVEEFVVE